jgi:hypothetical protein
MKTDAWSTLFERAADATDGRNDITQTRITRILDDRRKKRLERSQESDHQTNTESETPDHEGSTSAESASTRESQAESESSITEPATDPMPTSIVVDSDVLVADFLCGSESNARQAVEILWTHSWMTLFASDPLLTDAEAVIATVTTDQLAREWRSHMTDWCSIVTHPSADHPALSTAYRGGAMHILSFDDRLQSAQAGASLRGQFPVSVRDPAAYAAIFSPERLYSATVSETDTYPGPDRAPRVK